MAKPAPRGASTLAMLALGLALILWLAARLQSKFLGPSSSAPLAAVPQREVAPHLRDTAGRFEDVRNVKPDAAATRQPIAPETDASAIDGAFLWVESAAGLELAQVEWRAQDGVWAPRALVGGRLRTDGAPPFDVRAPGHLAARADRLGARLSLEPDGLVRISEPGPVFERSATVAMRCDDDELRDDWRQLMTFGPCADGTWALAVSSERLFWRGVSQVHLRLPLRGQRWLLCELRLQKGLRAQAAVAPDWIQSETAALVLDARRGAASAPSRWTVHLAAVSAGDEEWIRAADAVVGSLELQRLELERDWNVQGSRLEVAEMPLGTAFFWVAHDLASGASGNGRFVHTGAAQTLELGGGCRIRGRLTSSAALSLPRRADFKVSWNRPSTSSWFRLDDGPTNSLRADGVPVASDGSFELAALDGAEDFVVGRATLRLRVDALGFAPTTVAREVESASEYDLGEIELKLGEPLFEFALDDLDPRDTFNPSVSFEGGTFAVGFLQRLAQGGVGVFVPGDDPDAPLRGTAACGGEVLLRERPCTPRCLALLARIQEGARGARFLARMANGRYAPVDAREVEVELEVPAGDDPDRFWRLYVCWNEACVFAGELRAPAANEVALRRFRAPFGSTLAWVPHRRLNAGVSGPLAEPTSAPLEPGARIVLH